MMIKNIYYLYFVLICITLLVPIFSWSIWIKKHPDNLDNTIPSADRKQYGYFLHITDMHVDEDYVEGATVKSACHRLPDPVMQRANLPAVGGKYGAPGKRCDAPFKLAQETLEWISKEWKNKLDFVIWTGDNSRHDWDKTNKRKRRDVYELNQHVTDMMLETFWINDKIPVIPSFGNNDVYPHNRIGDATTDGDLLKFYESLYRQWIPTNQRSTFRQGGYYIAKVAPRLNVLSLNSMHFYTKNKIIKNCLHPSSPAAIQLEWFLENLKQAREKKEKIYVIGHVPPSSRDYKASCLTAYLKVAMDYSDVIQGHFFAHLNMDHFLMYDRKQAVTHLTQGSQSVFQQQSQQELVHASRNVKSYVGWLKEMYVSVDPSDDKRAPSSPHPPLIAIQVAPSVLPVYNPAFRIYQYEITPDEEEDDDDEVEEKLKRHRKYKDKDSEEEDDDDDDDGDDDDDDDDDTKPYGTLLGYFQYYANLTKWNNIETQEALQYELEYTTSEAYGMEDLTVESYFELAKAMMEDTKEGRKLWETYQTHMLVQSRNFSSSS